MSALQGGLWRFLNLQRPGCGVVRVQEDHVLDFALVLLYVNLKYQNSLNVAHDWGTRSSREYMAQIDRTDLW